MVEFGLVVLSLVFLAFQVAILIEKYEYSFKRAFGLWMGAMIPVAILIFAFEPSGWTLLAVFINMNALAVFWVTYRKHHK